MRPLKLVMSAFGSYAGQEEIDFSLINSGIFLVTGDTGSGKTTIFDAITYALYDKTSGGRRETNMMRSQYATLDTPTFVEFTFLYHNEIYNIRRNPEYERESKRKKADGSPSIIKAAAEVSFVMPNGQEFMGKRTEINKKIVDIIGLDAAQFSQTAMIAQGDFLKLLHASSDERKQIFTRIFDTGIYRRAAEQLRQKQKYLTTALEDNKKEILIASSGIRLEEDSALAVALKNALAAGEPDLFAIQELLVEAIESDSDRMRILKEQKEKTQKKLQDAGARLQNAKDTNLLFLELTKERKKESELMEIQGGIKEDRERLLWSQRAEQVVPFLESYNEKQKEYNKSKSNIQVYQNDLERLGTRVEKEKLFLEGMAGIQERCRELEACVALEREKSNRLNQLWQAIEKVRQMESELSGAALRLAESGECYKQKSKIYDRSYELFMNEQAGILAKQLTVGEPCPVCGSLSHPAPAQVTLEEVTQEQLTHQKQERELAERKRDRALAEYQKIKGEADSGRAVVENLVYQNMDAELVQTESEKEIAMNYDESISFAETSLQLSKEMISKYEKELREASKMAKTYEEHKETVQKLDLELTKLMGALENENSRMSDLDKQLQRVQKKYQSEWKKNGFESESQLLDSLLQRSQKSSMEKRITVYDKNINENSVRIRLLINSTKGKAEIDVQGLTMEYGSLTKELKEIDACINNSFSSVQRNREISKNLHELAGERENTRKEYESISLLSKTANGSVSGAAKIDFETFVLRQFFRQVIAAANKKLLKIADNRFKLICRDMDDLKNRGSAGLDLDIYSFATDSYRDVKTLSGGESFMAALAMALGMADIIQNSAGAIHLDTMFVDEGFGSLDDESREQAIGILNELAGSQRLVGIISHVAELKERIDIKLAVCKGRNGSRTQWLFT